MKEEVPTETVPAAGCVGGAMQGAWEGADLHISRRQLAVPNEHDCDDVQGGLIQAPTQNPHQLICDLGTWTQPQWQGGDTGGGSSYPHPSP